jgi:hypothetical protein
MRLAEHLIEQQDAAQLAPEAIRATLPEHGNRVTFTRSILVDTWAPLRLDLETKSLSAGGTSSRLGTLVVLGLLAILVILLARRQATVSHGA